MKENRKRKEKIINKEMMNEIFVINYQFSRSDVTGSIRHLPFLSSFQIDYIHPVPSLRVPLRYGYERKVSETNRSESR